MRSSVDTILDRLLASLLPPRCVLCHGRGQAPALDLCAECESEFPTPVDACPVCALPRSPDPETVTCGRCRRDPPPYERCLAAFDYDFPVDWLVQSLKYDGQLAVGRVLGTLLGAAAAARGLHLDVDVLLPVPLHPSRLAERGFNQSLEIARWAGRVVHRPLDSRALVRTRPTHPQVGLSLAERHGNLIGAFAAKEALRGRRVVVVDDVVTTGSTVREIAATLKNAGAFSVDVWCVARTDARGG
jgi:ComF family protein